MIQHENNPFSSNTPLYFDDFITRDFFHLGIHKTKPKHITIPLVNIACLKDAYLLEMAIPGVEESDFNIYIQNEVLVISIPNKLGNPLLGQKHYARQEFNYQGFLRSFYLPQMVTNMAQVRIAYKKGILEVFVPHKNKYLGLPPPRTF